MDRMDDVARVVLALEAPDVAEEVMHFLDRSGRARVVGTADDARQLGDAVRQLEPDAIVAEPSVAIDGVEGSSLFAVATRESIAALRGAVRAGARGFYLWPAEREGLLDGVASTLAARRRSASRTASVVAVHGARGGVGVTFVASHLAAAFVRRERTCVLVDADPVYADLTQALGAPDDARTLGELSTLGDELSPSHLEEVVWRHQAGFDVVLAPRESSLELPSDLLLRVVDAAATGADVVVAHLPRSLDAGTRAVVASADRLLEVLSLDVLSFRAATRALEAFSPLALEGRVGFVVNRAARNEITPGDVQRVFEMAPLGVVPLDGGVPRAQDHGRLLPPKGRVARAFDRLAERILEEMPTVQELAS